MNSNTLKDKIYNISDKATKELGYELVDIELNKSSKILSIIIYIYSKDGVDFDDCKAMSKKIEDDIDKLDIEESYYLEVSSPGLDRPLKNQDDYRRNLGNEVEVSLYAAIAGKKKFIGNLDNYDENNVTLDVDGERVEIPIKSISIMRQSIKF